MGYVDVAQVHPSSGRMDHKQEYAVLPVWEASMQTVAGVEP